MQNYKLLKLKCFISIPISKINDCFQTGFLNTTIGQPQTLSIGGVSIAVSKNSKKKNLKKNK